MYRLGWPLSMWFAALGMPLLIRVNIIHDDEAQVYVATSRDLPGLVVEADTLDELEKEVLLLVPELLVLNKPRLKDRAPALLSFSQPLIRV